MEEQRYVLPSNVYPSEQSTLGPVRPRLPLSDSTGNAQYHTVATANIYNDHKGLQPRPPPNFTLPTLPSQPARQFPQRSSLEARRSQIRAQKSNRGIASNPIVESENYQLYRSRQVKEGNKDDQKWPDDLEELFLEGELYFFTYLLLTRADFQQLCWLCRRWADASSLSTASPMAGMS
jgi:hypothetical protein